MDVGRDDPVPETGEDEIQLVPIHDCDVLGELAPCIFPVDNGDRSGKEGTGHDVAGDNNHDGQPLAPVVTGDTLAQQRSFLCLHGGDDAADRDSSVLASARGHERLRRRRVFVATSVSLVDQKPQLRINDRLQRQQTLLLAGVVLGERLNFSQPVGQLLEGGLVGFEEGFLPGDDIAAHDGLDVDEGDEDLLQRFQNLIGVRDKAVIGKRLARAAIGCDRDAGEHDEGRDEADEGLEVARSFFIRSTWRAGYCGSTRWPYLSDGKTDPTVASDMSLFRLWFTTSIQGRRSPFRVLSGRRCRSVYQDERCRPAGRSRTPGE